MITAVVLTKNEVNNIKDCLESLSFCDEILVIDDNSTDKTGSLAKSLGAKVIKRALNNDFASQHNFALSKAKNEWVLFIDADERVTEKLSFEIKDAVDSKKYDGYFIKRIDNIWGREIKYGEIGKSRFLRLAKKNSGKWERRVHERWKINGRVANLNNNIIHFSHQSVEEFIKNVDFFSSLHAEANMNEGKRSYIFKICFMPLAHFIRNYVFRIGFLDGIQGFVFAVVMSFHSFLAWSKLSLKQKNVT